MGNKIKNDNINESNMKIDLNEQNEEEFFDDISTISDNKNEKNKNKDKIEINIEHNPLISQMKSDPFQEYEVIKELGRGSFSLVRLVKHKTTGAIRAMKAIRRTPNQELEKNIKNEINILMKLDHPNIVKIFEFYISDVRYYLITEYCPGGSLYDLIISNKGPFTEIQASYIMHQLLSVVNYCHKMKIIHRDIKPENILISKNENGFPIIKLCDFGISLRFHHGDEQNKLVGSIYYIAPEVFKKKYNSKCDIWSCGVIMYILLTGILPFKGKDKISTSKKILNGVYEKSLLNKRCYACIDLIDKLLEKDRDKRIRADMALNHKWFDIFKSKEIRIDIEDPEIIKKFINNLKNYKKSNNIIELILAYLIHNHPELKEIDLACKIFEKIDKKGNGKIKKEEFYEGLSSFYKYDQLQEDINKIFEKNKYIKCEGFIRAVIDKKIFLSKDLLGFAFNHFDKEKKGEITIDEICSIFSEGKLTKKEIEQAKKMIKEANPDKSENINFRHFCEIMKSFLN